MYITFPVKNVPHRRIETLRNEARIHFKRRCDKSSNLLNELQHGKNNGIPKTSLSVQLFTK